MNKRYAYRNGEIHDTHLEQVFALNSDEGRELLVEYMNDVNDMVDDLNREEEHLLNVIVDKTDEIMKLDKKVDKLKYLLNKYRKLIDDYNCIIQNWVD